MRSLNLARVFAYALFAVPCGAFAAPTNYTSPLASMHDQRQHEKPLVVALEFRNNSPQEREVRIGDRQYVIRFGRTLHVTAPVGSVVRVFSNENSKVNGQELLVVSADDANREIRLM